jgi:uncharacterized iron-regulated protein
MTHLLLAVVFLAQSASPASAPAGDYVPQRVYDTRRGAFTDFESMVADLARADVVFVGEQHDNPGTHRLQEALLSGLRRRRVAATVSLEMFERDVQSTVDRYLSGAIAEPQFLEESRPWPRYATDYRPLVELAKREGWAVVAANVPRRFASTVAKAGQSAIEQVTGEDRQLIAAELQCPRDAYFERFTQAMSGHASGDGNAPAPAKPPTEEQRASNDRYYWSQCLKDETMAESVVRAVAARAGKGGPVVHVTGAFHSDFGAGTAERTRRRLAGQKVKVISMLPVADLDAVAPAGDDLKRADFLVYTLK